MRSGILLCSLLLLAGCSSKPKDEAVESRKVEDNIRAVIKDPAKSDFVINEYNQEKALFGSMKEEHLAFRERLRELHKNYNTPDGQFDVFFSSLNARTVELQKIFLDRQMALREKLTAEEWKDVHKVLISGAVKKFKETYQ